uniref:Uncharacterized protein n=1 Tax=Cyprinus carpio TaxID=7962 RepID=A0A8C2KWJ5_CYPCA
MRRGPIYREFTLVFAGGRPSSYFLFLWTGLRLPPVLRRLCQLSLEIPLGYRDALETNLSEIKPFLSTAYLSVQFSKVYPHEQSDSAIGFIIHTQD